MSDLGAVRCGSVTIAPATAAPAARAQARELGAAFAGNTGNMVFEEALQALCPAARISAANNAPAMAQYDHVIVSLANSISPYPLSAGLAWFAEQVAQTRRLNPSVRFVVTAIGAQYPAFDASVAVHPDRLKLVRELAETAAYVGVRGYYTAEILHAHGVRNTWVIGDPALLHPRITKQAPTPAQGGHVVVGWTPTGWYRDVYRGFLDWARRHDAVLVAQSTQERLLPVPGQHNVIAGPDLPAILEYYCWPGKPHAGLEAWMVRRGACFAQPEDWYHAVTGARLALGTRFHGNAAAIIAGVPALQLTLDTRTAELSAFHGLPSLALQDFDPRLGPAAYLELATAGALHQRVATLRGNLYAFWRSVGLHAGPLASGAPGNEPDGHAGFTPGEPGERPQFNLRQRYVLRALEHALAPDGSCRLTEEQARAVLQVTGAPRGSGLGELIDAAPGLLFAARQAGLDALAGRVSGPLGVPP